MRVLVSAVSRFSTPTGICRHAANLVVCLNSQDAVDSVVLAIGKWQTGYFAALLGKNRQQVRVEVVDIPNNSLHRNWWFAMGLPEMAARCAVDVVHLSFPVPVTRNRFRVPVVCTVHDLYPYDIPENFGYPRVILNRLFLRKCISEVDRLACVSQATLSRLSHYFPDAVAKAVVIPNVAVAPSVPPKPLSSVARPYLLCVAQHRQNKNLDIVLKAFALARQEKDLSDFVLIIVGAPGPKTKQLIALTRPLGLQNHVKFIDNVDDGELRWLYENTAAVIAASSIEGFGLPVLEALVTGSPVICSDIPAFREVGGGHCKYFSLGPRADTRLAEQIAEVLRAQPRVAKAILPDLRNTGADYLNLYSTLISATSPISESPNQFVTK
ncbi:MAG TPA: glycosyltransferase family 1 protein [Terriglobales bacterium]|nr:glycosyltransferase family 1 protein [Terriglobales bacterium]